MMILKLIYLNMLIRVILILTLGAGYVTKLADLLVNKEK